VAKSKYKDEWCLLVEKWARDGLDDKQMYENLGISHDTFYKYNREIPAFAEALKRGKAPRIIHVENALYKRALGYSYTEKKTVEKQDGSIEKTETIKEVIPDVTAQIFFLKCKDGEHWKDKQIIESTNTNVNLEKNISEEMTAEEASQIYTQALRDE